MKNGIRSASKQDFDALYELGLTTPEFQVSSSGPFMEPDEFAYAIESPHGVFLVAESEKEGLIGFIYANRQDPERGPVTQWACLVYLVVKPEYRGRGVAQALYEACVKELKLHDVNRLYGWAEAESNGSIIQFLKKNGFVEGHKYAWMDREI
ncbi:GNAT family N-acetyltransferase [Candidatus Uhrbacteria bacterium]|nr:GNAT family N-acetyltransferase [Candidatus Uhrbacteria bacterium]